MKRAERIGLLPGTFDPVHLGHVAMAREALRVGGLREVWFLVDVEPVRKRNALSFRHRLAMVELALGNEVDLRLVEPVVRILPHTVAGFGRLMSSYPDKEFVYVLGMDLLSGLDVWEDYESVVKDTAFLVADRGDGGVGALDSLRLRLGALGSELRVQQFGFSEYSGVSSTAVRQLVAAGLRPDFLDPLVYAYIERHGLYC